MNHCIIFVYYWKNIKSTSSTDLYLNQILHHFYLKKNIPKINNKKFMKRKQQGAPLLFLYEVSIVCSPNWFHSNTPNYRHLFDTNIYLIHFHSKNIKMCFSKVGFLKFQTFFRHSLSIVTRWNKLRWQQQRSHNTVLKTDKKKRLIILYIYIHTHTHTLQNFDIFLYIF